MVDNVNNEKPTILTKILNRKIEEVAERSQNLPLAEIKAQLADISKPRAFAESLENKVNNNLAGIIAEIKKASPSKGVIREDFFPAQIAKSYEKGGAACISVLTDVDFFQGADAYLKEVKEAAKLPVLRKDFMVDEYQIYESRLLGADCILLIVAALDDPTLRQLNNAAIELGMDVLIEVHNVDELERAIKLQSKLIGINNRNLKTFSTRLGTTFDLLPMIPDDKLVVTESGIHTTDDIAAMRGHNVHAFLVGEAFMRAEDPGQRLMELFGAGC